MKGEADVSPLGESFSVVKSGESYRVGVGYKKKEESSMELFIELMLTLCPKIKPNLDDLEAQLRILKTIEARGYVLICENDGTITCETLVAEKDLKNEIEAISLLLE